MSEVPDEIVEAFVYEEAEAEEDSPVPSDEPEEVSEEEAKTTDIPLGAQEEPHLTSTVCDVCLELNLTHKPEIIYCARCSKPFCYHFASSIDVQYCVNCMSDISVSKSVITKTYEHKNEETGQKTFYRRKAREIQVGGLDWLFAQRKIVEISDMELDLVIEYHRNILGLEISEQETRRTAKMHRYAGVKFHIPTPATTTATSGTSTTTKRTRTISKNKAAEQLAALLKSVQSKGITAEQIAQMLKAQKK